MSWWCGSLVRVLLVSSACISQGTLFLAVQRAKTRIDRDSYVCNFFRRISSLKIHLYFPKSVLHCSHCLISSKFEAVEEMIAKAQDQLWKIQRDLKTNTYLRTSLIIPLSISFFRDSVSRFLFLCCRCGRV